MADLLIVANPFNETGFSCFFSQGFNPPIKNFLPGHHDKVLQGPFQWLSPGIYIQVLNKYMVDGQ